MINKKIIAANFSYSGLGQIVIINDCKYATVAVTSNVDNSNPYWKSTIKVTYYPWSGTIEFIIDFKGSSIPWENLRLTDVYYIDNIA